MEKQRTYQPNSKSVEERQRERETRQRFQSMRPGLDELEASGDYEPAISQGQYLALMELAAELKKLREQGKLSLSDLAERTGIDKSALSRLENKHTENPTVFTLLRVAAALGKNLRFVLEDAAAPHST